MIPKIIGVLSFLGPFTYHKNILEKLGVTPSYVKTENDLESVDALIIPGSELQALEVGLKELLPCIQKRVKHQMPLLLTGEACVLLSEDQKTELSLKKLSIEKYHKDSAREFHEHIQLTFSDTREFDAYFIRPPYVKHVPSDIQVLAKNTNNQAVCLEKKSIVACTFFPEFSHDVRLHEYFITKV